MELYKIPYKSIETCRIINHKNYSVDYINKLKVMSVDFSNNRIFNFRNNRTFDINIYKCLIDNKYIIYNNYIKNLIFNNRLSK